MERIRLEHDNKLLNPDWKPSKVIITSGSRYVTEFISFLLLPVVYLRSSPLFSEWLFPCGKWIGKKKGNGLEEMFNVFTNKDQPLPEQKKKKKGLFGFRS